MRHAHRSEQLRLQDEHGSCDNVVSCAVLLLLKSSSLLCIELKWTLNSTGSLNEN